jgi:hypothetical protein
VFVIIRTEDGGRQTALEDRVRARGSDPNICHLNFPFLANKANQTNTTNQLIAICHLSFVILHFSFCLQPLTSNLFRLSLTATLQHCNTAEPQIAQSSFSEISLLGILMP